MPPTKGFVGIGVLLAVLVALVMVGGGAYYIGHQNAAPSAQPNYPDLSTTQQTQQTTSNTHVQATTNTTASTPTPAPAPLTTQASISVSGMSKYTDTNFGFTFWYPSNWTVNKSSNGSNLEDCTFQKGYSIHGNRVSNGVSIAEYYCPNLSMTLRGNNGANPVGMDFKYYFDTNTHTWMITDLSDPPNGSPRTTSAANVSDNTMGSLHILAGEARFGADVVIPLSARNFLIVSTNDGGGYVDERVFAKTIVATDPSDATPVSVAEQTQTVQAEKDAFSSLDDTPSLPSATISSISPTTANPGDTVTVYGTNFDSNTTIQLASAVGVTANTAVISSTKLTFIVPSGSTLQQISEGRSAQFPYRVIVQNKVSYTMPGIVLTIPGY